MKYSASEAAGLFIDVIDYIRGDVKVIVRNKTIIQIVPKDKRFWVKVSFRDSPINWYPSFEDLFYILKGLAKCEKYAYSNPGQSGEIKFADFINDSIFGDFSYEELKEKYELPNKESPKFERV